MDRPTLHAADESVHVPGSEPLWNESWYFDFLTPEADLGGYVRIGRYPNLGVIWYWACLVGEGRPLVLVVDHTVPLPRNERSLEIRNDGLWADHAVNDPFVHWNLGLEAFGVALDDPAVAFGDLRGERTALGFDLEWETDGTPYRYPVGLDRYEVPCDVHGTIQVGSETIAFDGIGQRDHSWGVRDWWANGWCWSAFRRGDGRRIHGVTTIPPMGFAAGYDQSDGGDEVRDLTTFDVEVTDGPNDLPTRLRAVYDGVGYDVEPIDYAPILLEAGDGRTTKFPRATARFTADDGDVGYGWFEVNQLRPR